MRLEKTRSGGGGGGGGRQRGPAGWKRFFSFFLCCIFLGVFVFAVFVVVPVAIPRCLLNTKSGG